MGLLGKRKFVEKSKNAGNSLVMKIRILKHQNMKCDSFYAIILGMLFFQFTNAVPWTGKCKADCIRKNGNKGMNSAGGTHMGL